MVTRYPMPEFFGPIDETTRDRYGSPFTVPAATSDYGQIGDVRPMPSLRELPGRLASEASSYVAPYVDQGMQMGQQAISAAKPYVAPYVEQAASAGKQVTDRLTDLSNPFEGIVEDAASGLQKLPEELMGVVGAAKQSMPSMPGFESVPEGLVSIKDQAMKALGRAAPSLFDTPKMAAADVPEAYMPTSGLTVAPKGGVTREGTANDVAVQQLAEGLGGLRERAPATSIGYGEALQRGIGDMGIDLVTSLPAMPWEIINLPISGMAKGAEMLGYDELAQGFREGQENPGVLWPLKAMADAANAVETEQVRAGLGILGDAGRRRLGQEAPGDDRTFQERYQDEVYRSEDVLRQKPNAYAGGRLLGAPLYFAGTKGAGAKGLQRIERGLDRGVDTAEAQAAAFKSGQEIPKIPLGSGPAAQKAKRAFAHGMENAADTMLMGIANDADPATAAGVGAATSLGAGGVNKMLDYMNPIRGVPGVPAVGKFMGEMAGAFTTMYALQQLTPGKDENVFEAVEGAAEKALAASAVALISKGQGTRGSRMGAAGTIAPVLTEAISNVPRQFLNSFVSLQLGEPRQAAMDGMRATFEGAENLTEERRNELVKMMDSDPDAAMQEFIRIGRGLKGQMQ